MGASYGCSQVQAGNSWGSRDVREMRWCRRMHTGNKESVLKPATVGPDSKALLLPLAQSLLPCLPHFLSPSIGPSKHLSTSLEQALSQTLQTAKQQRAAAGAGILLLLQRAGDQVAGNWFTKLQPPGSSPKLSLPWNTFRRRGAEHGTSL